MAKLVKCKSRKGSKIDTTGKMEKTDKCAKRVKAVRPAVVRRKTGRAAKTKIGNTDKGAKW